MKFRYKNVAPGVYRPLIPVQFLPEGDTEPFCFEVLVDSGADICIFPAEIGELIGLDIYSGVRRNVSGITGASEPYYVHDIRLSVGGQRFSLEAGFMFNPPKDWYGVLGQKGFFDKFKVSFDYAKKEIEVKQSVR